VAHAIESMFVVTEKDDKGEEAEPYLTPDLDKIQKTYAPKVMPGHFEDAVLVVPEWTFGVSVRRATEKDRKKFAEDSDLLQAVHEYKNLADYIELKKTELADTILLNAYDQIKDKNGLIRFLDKTKLTTSQLQALNAKSTDLVNATPDWLDIYAEYVASKATEYTNSAGVKTKRSKQDVLADWK